MSKDQHHHPLTAAGLLVTLGIIYGDIGTSPLYTLKEIIGTSVIEENVVLGAVSCIFWTLTMQTTLKYILLTLQADNKGEGGIFALYTLVRRSKKKWLLIPAIIGGAAIMGEGIITPPISVSSAVEGLRIFHPEINTVPIVIAIIVGLFFIQQFGTKTIGKLFGPIMFIWFFMLAILGVAALMDNFSILKSLNPYYGYALLVKHPGGFWLLGAIFLCTTGAEALYSDLGHCGKSNIRVTWTFVKTCLLLNYMGQGAWLLNNVGHKLSDFHGSGSPFYLIMPEWFEVAGVVIATVATVVASQALISGSFTLINIAIRLDLWPKVKIKYPTNMKGQLYIPSVNWLLLAGCITIVLLFRESSNMAAAYGLTIILGMMMSSTLLVFYMKLRHFPKIIIGAFILVYATIESSFLIANIEKIPNGGWVSLTIAALLFGVMFVWHDAKRIRNDYVEFVKLSDYKQLLFDLSKDNQVPKYSTHLVYLTSSDNQEEIESKIIYSILQKQPKRADIYWFIHVDVMDEPFTMKYQISEVIHDDIIRVNFKLGFRVAPKINQMFRLVVQEMVARKEVDITSRYESLNKNNVVGDFRFIVLEKYLSNENDLPFYQKVVLDIYFFLKNFSLSEEKAFGLDTSSVAVEKVPLLIAKAKPFSMERIE